MKKRIYYFIFFSMMIIVFTAIFLIFPFNSKSKNISLLENSTFLTFKIKNNIVEYDCILYLKNETNKEQKFYIRAVSLEDKIVGLLADKNMFIYDDNDMEKVFVLLPNEERSFEIIFRSDSAGKKQKFDRELPDIYFYFLE